MSAGSTSGQFQVSAGSIPGQHQVNTGSVVAQCQVSTGSVPGQTYQTKARRRAGKGQTGVSLESARVSSSEDQSGELDIKQVEQALVNAKKETVIQRNELVNTTINHKHDVFKIVPDYYKQCTMHTHNERNINYRKQMTSSRHA